jgi:hydrogenase nickel incorporation protein HypA/HybF
MHELSLAGGILKLVEDSAAREGFRRVRRLRLEAGALAGVELRALRFALDALAPGSLLEGAEIQIDQPPGRAFCMGCGESVEIAARTDPCPACGSHKLTPTGGLELRVLDLIVVDEAAVPDMAAGLSDSAEPTEPAPAAPLP